MEFTISLSALKNSHNVVWTCYYVDYIGNAFHIMQKRFVKACVVTFPSIVVPDLIEAYVDWTSVATI